MTIQKFLESWVRAPVRPHRFALCAPFYHVLAVLQHLLPSGDTFSILDAFSFRFSFLVSWCGCGGRVDCAFLLTTHTATYAYEHDGQVMVLDSFDKVNGDL